MSGDHTSLHFVGGDCAPLSDFAPYFFTFHPQRDAGDLRLTKTAPPEGSLGNYPVPVRVGREFVKCGSSRYLARFGGAISFSLGCIKPLS